MNSQWMKQNKAPLFVKLNSPQSKFINKKQLCSLWGQPEQKQFHIINNPSLITKLAEVNQQNRRNYSSVKVKTQNSQICQKRKDSYVFNKTKKSTERLKYSKMRQEVNCLTDYIDNSVDKLKQSQIFQYKQKMLTKFLQGFFKQIELECHEKADFIKKIWNNLIGTFDQIISIQCQNSSNYQKSSLNQIIHVHKQYQKLIQNTRQSNLVLREQSSNQKQLIRTLVKNLRQRKKQIKVYEGGLNQYNNQINQLSMQFSQLKKQHLDVLMYGHTGNMTKQEAQDLLMQILKPKPQDQQIFKKNSKFKFRTPKLRRGKSDKYIKDITQPSVRFIEINDQLETKKQFQTNNQFETNLFLEENNINEYIDSQSYELKNNFIPQKLKIKQSKAINVKVQTQNQSYNKQKISSSTECDYFTKMHDSLIKSKYCQTQNKKIQFINGSSQTQQSDFQKSSKDIENKIFICSNICQYTFNKQIQSDNKLKKSYKRLQTIQFNDTDNKQNVYNYPAISSNQQTQSQNQGDTNQSIIRKDNKLGKSQKEQKKSQKNIRKAKQQSSVKQLLKNNSRFFRKSIKSSIKQLKTQGNDQKSNKFNPKTQNFIKANKARVSINTKDFTNKMLCSLVQKDKLLLRVKNQNLKVNFATCFFKCQGAKDMREQRQTWSQNILRNLIRCRNYPQTQEMPLSAYYNSKFHKNINLSEANSIYSQKLKQHLQTLNQKNIQKKNEKTSYFFCAQGFTLKKTYKIISQVFQICSNLRNQRTIMNINLIDVLQIIFNPENIRSVQKQSINCRQINFNEPVKSCTYNTKTLDFLKFLVKNIQQSYLIRNFVFLCGINIKSSEGEKRQTHVVNINKNVHIQGQKGKSRKHMHIETAVKFQHEQSQLKNNYTNEQNMLFYASQVCFYIDTFKALNCYTKSSIDIQNAYTTFQVLQQNFENFPSYYQNSKLLSKIKQIIIQSMSGTITKDSKLNIFKCLQIFLDKIMEQKLQIRQSYEQLYENINIEKCQPAPERVMSDILSIIRASPQSQLKIISKYVKFYKRQFLLGDFITFSIIQGLPSLQKIIYTIKMTNQPIPKKGTIKFKSDNIVLRYFHNQAVKAHDYSLVQKISMFSTQLIRETKIQAQVQQIIGEDLHNLNKFNLIISKSQQGQNFPETISSQIHQKQN